LDNDQYSQAHWRDQAEEQYREAEERNSRTRRDVATYELADLLKAEINEAMPELPASMYADILGAALSEINYDEIARHYIDEVADEIDEEEKEEAETDS
jgi:hypothetical protein